MDSIVLILSASLLAATICIVIEAVALALKCRAVRRFARIADYYQDKAEDGEELLDRIEILNANLDRLIVKSDRGLPSGCECAKGGADEGEEPSDK